MSYKTSQREGMLHEQAHAPAEGSPACMVGHMGQVCCNM